MHFFKFMIKPLFHKSATACFRSQRTGAWSLSLKVERHAWRDRINVVRYFVVIFEDEPLAKPDRNFRFGECFIRLADFVVRRKHWQRDSGHQ